MASSYSTDLKLELMVTGENAGTWGDKTNTNLNLVQQAIAGVESITLTDAGTKALTMSDAALSDARNMVLKLATITLSGASNLTIPDGIEKFYILDATAVTNPTNLTFKTASGTGFTLDAAKIYAAYSNGTNIVEVSLDTLGGTIGSAQIADDAVTTAKILQSNVTTAKLAQNAVTSNQITQSSVTLTKMAANSVGPNQLQSTAVTAGSYTTADITVDEDGRITSAASGSAGATIYGIKKWAIGPGTGSVATTANTSQLFVWMQSAAGGGGGTWFNPTPPHSGGNGGVGKFGVFTIPVSASSQYPFSLGAGGTGGGGTPGAMTAPSGNASGTVDFNGQTYINAANGGTGATYNSSNGSPGAAATFAIPATVEITPTTNPLSQIYQNYSLPNLGGTAQIPNDADGFWFNLTRQDNLQPGDLPFHGQGGGSYPEPYGSGPPSGQRSPGIPGGDANMVIFDKLD